MKKFIIIILICSFSTISKSANEDDIYKKIDLFSEVLDKINKEYVEDVNQSDAMDAAINGVLQSLDPYSAYMSPDSFENMQTETSGEFGGLGIEVGMEAGVVKVISPIDNSPASKVGIKAGDYIVKINDIQVQGKSLTEAVDLMRGPVGTDIEITVRRVGEKKALTFVITRDIIKVASVKSEIIDDKTGYIRLTSFNENSSDQIEDKIKEFKKYKTKKDTRIILVNIIGIKNKPSIQSQLKFKAIEEGTFYARDLVSEPGNILHPDEYAKRITSLKKYGLKINFSYEKKIKGTGGALVKARRLIHNEPFLLLSGDLWSDYPFEKFLEFKLKKAAHLIFIKDKNGEDAYLESGIVKNSKTKNNLTYSGIAVIHPKIFKELKEDYYDLWADLLQKHIKHSKVTGEIYSGDLVNLNSKKEMNLLDALVVE